MGHRDPLAHPESLIRRIYAYVAYRIGDGAGAEDVTSDGFERALRYRESYDRGKGEPAAWLIGIARRSVDSHLAARPPVACFPIGIGAFRLLNGFFGSYGNKLAVVAVRP